MKEFQQIPHWWDERLNSLGKCSLQAGEVFVNNDAKAGLIQHFFYQLLKSNCNG
jgi:hypothetical protein